jgi:hypothetical protein
MRVEAPLESGHDATVPFESAAKLIERAVPSVDRQESTSVLFRGHNPKIAHSNLAPRYAAPEVPGR